MIPARRIDFLSNWFTLYMRFRMWWLFKRIVVMPLEPRQGHSILLLCNHFSWWDGFFGNYLAYRHLKRKLYIMMQEDHLRARMILNLFGGFSISRGSGETLKSLFYAADLLKKPENLVVVFPQGELISNHATEINIEKGIMLTINHIKAPCQIIYSCVLIDYFESLKPSAYIHLLDCGLAGEVTYDDLVKNINAFHKQALKDQVNAVH